MSKFKSKKFAKEVALFLDIKPYSIKFEDLGEARSKFYLHDEYIAVNKNLKKDDQELMIIITHEYRKIFQMQERLKHAKSDLHDTSYEYRSWVSENKISKELRYDQSELDEQAFTRYYLKRFYNIELTYEFDEYIHTLDNFINNNLDRFELDRIKQEKEEIRKKDLEK